GRDLTQWLQERLSRYYDGSHRIPNPDSQVRRVRAHLPPDRAVRDYFFSAGGVFAGAGGAFAGAAPALPPAASAFFSPSSAAPSSGFLPLPMTSGSAATS